MESKEKISVGVAEDGSEIIRITETTGFFDETEVDAVRELWDEYLRYGGMGSGYHFFVYKEEERVLGFTCFGPRPLTQGTYDLYWIAVSPEKSKNGIGRKLMRFAEQSMREMGARLVIVETSGSNKYYPTRQFYLGIGYNEEAIIRDFYKTGDDLVIYTRKL